MKGDSAFALTDVELVPWQTDACDRWQQSSSDEGPFRGTLEIFTGGGKSLIALECLRRAAEREPSLRAAIVVPTLALARQWRRVLLDRTALEEPDVGRLDGERKDDLVGKRVIVAVLNSAAEHLPAMARVVEGPLMLIVDECHRAGAPRFSRVLDTRADYRLGLSATADREDVDEDGQPVDYDDHVLGEKLGRIVYRFDLRAAREVGWLPEYTVHHHAVELHDEERRKYEELIRRVDDLADQLRGMGVEASGARQAVSRGGELGSLARMYIGAVAGRKDLLYRAQERARVVEHVLRRLAQRDIPPRVLLFHERIGEAKALFDRLSEALPELPVGLEHSQLGEQTRRSALGHFADGSVPVLVSVKSLVEGIDVPDADVGVSVASSASVRQRVQALGRVLRRRFDGTEKVAEMHVVYVHDTVDEAIYAKEDWSDLTGAAANRYLLWKAGTDEPQALPGPPRTPRPTEDQVWERLGEHVPSEVVPWEAEWPPSEWRLDSRGTITDLTGRPVTNPQGAVSAVQRVKSSGGRFRVSSRHRLLVVPDVSRGEVRAWLVGKIDEPFRVSESDTTQAAAALAAVATVASSALVGPLDRSGGSFHLRQKHGGVIERKVGATREFAGTAAGEGPDDLVANARKVLDAWRALGEAGLQFHVNSADEAYFMRDGSPVLLGHIPGGFTWPG